MAQHRVLVTGASGNLGQDLLARLQLFDRFETVGTTSRELNLTWEKPRLCSVLDELKPDIIINTAAFTQVDAAESEYETALQVNAAGPEALAEWANHNARYLVHISTDYVFDGCKGSPYTPEDPTNPINRYGQSKRAGEHVVREILPEASAVVRTSWLFGAGARNFVPFIIQAAQTQTPVQAITDQWGVPTWTGNLSKMLLEVIDQRMTGVLHGCSTGMTTRYDQAMFIVDALGASSEFMTPMTMDAFDLPAKRPQNTAMQSSFGCALSWQDATQRFLLTQGLLKSHV